MSGIKSIKISNEYEILGSGGKDGSGRIWSLNDQKFQHSLNGHQDNVCCFAFCNGERVCATGSWD